MLRALLDGARLGMLEQLFRADAAHNPFWDPVQGSQATAGLDAFGALVVRLWCIGEAVGDDEAAAALDHATVQELVDGGLLERAEGGLRSPWRVVTYAQRHLLATPPAHDERFDPRAAVAYVGPESLFMAPVVAGARRCRRALEIGPGAGLLTMLIPAKTVVAVELDPFAAAVARFNAALGAYDHIEVREGSLFGPVSGERFDLVVANPPFLPAPPAVPLPLCGDGGPHGDRVLRALLDGLPAHLEGDGRALIYGEDLGDADEPLIAAWLRERWSAAHDATVHVTHTRYNERTALRLTALWQACGAGEQEAWDAWIALMRDRPASHHHSFVIDVTPGAGRVSVVRRSRF